MVSGEWRRVTLCRPPVDHELDFGEIVLRVAAEDHARAFEIDLAARRTRACSLFDSHRPTPFRRSG